MRTRIKVLHELKRIGKRLHFFGGVLKIKEGFNSERVNLYNEIVGLS